MAHYAYLDENNIVVAVTVGKDETELIDGLDTETYYAQGTPYTVKRTSYSGSIRFNYAGIGYTYDQEADAFIAAQPECGHKELFLNDKFQWNCQACDLEAKALRDET
jgi:alpha-ketoglutarate-dependent taurine dioxygenase